METTATHLALFLANKNSCMRTVLHLADGQGDRWSDTVSDTLES